MKTYRFLLVLLAASLGLVIPTDSSAAVWYPKNTSVYDGNSHLLLARTSGTGYIRYIECKSTLTGKTYGPIYGYSELVSTISVSGCTANGEGLGVASSGPTGSISFIAKKPSVDPYGPVTGGGDVRIPSTTSYEFQINIFGNFWKCTLTVNKGVQTYVGEAFTIRNSYLSPEWGINKMPISVSVGGPNASQCASSSTWVLDTWHPDTHPYLEIRAF